MTKLAKRAAHKIIREVLKSIPFIGIIFKVAFIIVDLAGDSDENPVHKRGLATKYILTFFERCNLLIRRASACTLMSVNIKNLSR
jgi:hypothetical protein